jgi:hypothetical protein
MGYTAKSARSEVTGLPLLRFDSSDPYTRQIPFKNRYTVTDSVRKPLAYLVPQAWTEVVERLKLNGVRMQRISHDTLLDLNCYYINDRKTGKAPYEGHFVHSDVKTDERSSRIMCFAGDYLIECNQDCNRYIIETLEPAATDAFFAWGFFGSQTTCLTMSP